MKEPIVLMTPKEVSKEFGLNLNYVYSLINRKKLTTEYLKNGQLVVEKSSVNRYLDNSTRRPGAGKRGKKFVKVTKPSTEVKVAKPNKDNSVFMNFATIVLATILGVLLGSLLMLIIK